MNKREDIELASPSAIHEDVVDKVKSIMEQEEKLYELASFFKVLGEATRVKILYALLKTEMCVGDIALSLDMNSSAISHQLRILKQARLVKFRKEGKMVYYSLDDDHVKNVFEQGFEHINHG